MSSKKMYKAVFLDWDDTLGDWCQAACHSQQDIYDKYRLSEFFPTFEAYYAAYETHNVDLWRQYSVGQITRSFLHRDRFLWPMVQQLGGMEILFQSPKLIDMADRMGADFLELTNRYFTLLPGAKELVEYLAARYPLTIISNGFVEVQYYKLAHSGLQSRFQHILISEEVGINKPMPGIFEQALKCNGVNKDEAIMIGDSYYSDISGAQNAGIDQLWVRFPDRVKNEGEHATYEVESLAQVMDIL